MRLFDNTRSLTRSARFLIVSLLTAHALPAQQTQLIESGWRFHAVSAPEHKEAEQWHTAVVPGEAQTDLLHHQLIPDPFHADNEKLVQWVGTTDWEYTTTFPASAATRAQTHAELVFDGLDTFADVTLNGETILHADNMFRSWRVDVTGKLRATNELRVVLHSPINTIAPIAAKLPYIIPGTGYEKLDRAHGIYPTSQYVRKAGYSFGWDWGPRLVTIGIWRPVHLDTWSGAHIAALHLEQSSVTAERAITELHLEAQSDRSGPATLAICITAPDGHTLPERRIPVVLDRGENAFTEQLRIEHPARWYPNGYGPQNLYTVQAQLLVGVRVLAAKSLHAGLRSVELHRAADAWGKSFEFVINGIPVYAKGADFVPLDSFPPDVTPARRLAILQQAHDAHMNMLRIWGGGYYEPDDFYEDADRLGIMIWHDFMFGGSMIPHDQHYMDNVKAEAIEQVSRLSDHPSLVLWCGNNEVETAWDSWGDRLAFKKSLTADQQQQVWQDYLLVFRDVLKLAVAEHGNGVPYWPSSPGADFEDAAGNTHNGDVHSWKVWSAGAPISTYSDTTPRFLSEFGFQSMPELRTVRSFAGNDESLTSPALLNHERFVHGFDRMQQYLSGEFRTPRDFASFLYLSQLEQGEAIRYGVETMRSRRPQNMGTLYWQLDDCWPVASWSSIDYFGRPKALQFYARRFYAPLLIVAVGSHPGTPSTTLQLHVVSDELQPRTKAQLRIRVLSFTGDVLHEELRPIDIHALASNDAGALDIEQVHGFDPHHDFVALTLEDAHGRPLATQTAYMAAAKDLDLPPAGLTAALQLASSDKGFVLTLHTKNLARAVAVSFDDLAPALHVSLEDNFFDMLPGETRSIHITSNATLAQLRAALHVRSLEDSTR